MSRNILMLGTGHATATNCYNTCFLINNEDSPLLIDSGGGNGILSQFERSHTSLNVCTICLSLTLIPTIYWAPYGSFGKSRLWSTPANTGAPSIFTPLPKASTFSIMFVAPHYFQIILRFIRAIFNISQLKKAAVMIFAKFK